MTDCAAERRLASREDDESHGTDNGENGESLIEDDDEDDGFVEGDESDAEDEGGEAEDEGELDDLDETDEYEDDEADDDDDIVEDDEPADGPLNRAPEAAAGRLAISPSSARPVPSAH